MNFELEAGLKKENVIREKSFTFALKTIDFNNQNNAGKEL